MYIAYIRPLGSIYVPPHESCDDDDVMVIMIERVKQTAEQLDALKITFE